MNLEKRGDLWYAVVMVPRPLRATLGIKFIQSLKTNDKQEAQLRAFPLITRWKEEIKKAHEKAHPESLWPLVWKRDIENRTPLWPLVAEWEEYTTVAKKTMDQYRRDLTKLAMHFRTVEAITPKAVKLWADELAAAGSTHSSLNRILKACKGFWNYLRKSSTIELERADPFAGILSLVSGKVARNRQGRVAWDRADLARIYQVVSDNYLGR
jgi:hypothetical protein